MPLGQEDHETRKQNKIQCEKEKHQPGTEQKKKEKPARQQTSDNRSSQLYQPEFKYTNGSILVPPVVGKSDVSQPNRGYQNRPLRANSGNTPNNCFIKYENPTEEQKQETKCRSRNLQTIAPYLDPKTF
ncbi:hypothetical protein AVEN_152213-1 [Araneus ventricosus]|uniref:Uncharacterized protein n=1 Tax=Araneus ventricosus TaxID=182803 RepID=A0A4Y2HLR6_ARAVE|nr:hypothetical protein AVEN_152213-1 [Araneus ventricosus]